jgi:hypothetical protein
MEKQMNTFKTPIENARPRHIQTWHYYATATACCVVLVAGFFFAARQHFSSMEYGLQNSRLRRQLDELQSEKRKLLVTREVSMSPIELRKAVRRIGFMDSPASHVEAIKSGNLPVQKTVLDAVQTKKPDLNPTKVVKTVMSAPINKPSAMDKQARRETSNTKKDRT